jgi:hypothetical protein
VRLRSVLRSECNEGAQHGGDAADPNSRIIPLQ